MLTLSRDQDQSAETRNAVVYSYGVIVSIIALDKGQFLLKVDGRINYHILEGIKKYIQHSGDADS